MLSPTYKISSILLVDDDYITNYCNQALIEGMAIAKNVTVVTNGLEALNILVKGCMLAPDDSNSVGCPDLILLDINMPVMNGLEFLAELSKIHGDHLISSKIFLLSSSDNPKDMLAAEKFGVKGCLGKPLTEESLLTILEEWDNLSGRPSSNPEN